MVEQACVRDERHGPAVLEDEGDLRWCQPRVDRHDDHSREGAAHGEFVDDETADRFSVLGTVEQHVAKLKELEAIGVKHFNIYLMIGDRERTIDVYGKDIIPHFA